MGSGPSKPTRFQRKQLKAHHEELCKLAAGYIHDADVLMVCTGAGFSADSGLAVYVDIAKIPAYAERELEYYDLCQPQWIEHDPETFYGFWGQCFNDYRKTQPHEGYEIIAKWKKEKNRPRKKKKVDPMGRSRYKGEFASRIEARIAKARRSDDYVGPYEVDGIAGAFYLFTSNVDAHSFDYFKAHEIRECHGNTELWQCANSCTDEVWRAPSSGFAFQVDLNHMIAASATSLPCITEDTADDPTSAAKATATPAAKNDRKTVAKIGATLGSKRLRTLRHMPDGIHQYPSAFQEINRPICPKCNSLARPNILMFDDCEFIEDDAQSERFSRWCAAVDTELAQGKRNTSSRKYLGAETASGVSTGVTATTGVDQDGSQTSPAAAAAAAAATAATVDKHTSAAMAHTTSTGVSGGNDDDDNVPLPRVAIVEIGAGGNVTTVRYRSERLLERWSSHAQCKLIRINPELPLADLGTSRPNVISIMEKGLKSLRRINQYKSIYATKTDCAPADQDPALRGVRRFLLEELYAGAT